MIEKIFRPRVLASAFVTATLLVFLGVGLLILGFRVTGLVLLAVAFLGGGTLFASVSIRAMKASVNANHKLVEVQKSVQNVRSSLDSVASTARDTASTTKDIDARLTRLNPIIRDTASSVGRSAPLIRKIHEESGKVYSSVPRQSATDRNVVVRNPVAELVEYVYPDRGKPTFDINVLVIADQFSLDAFQYEWNQIEPTPQNWRHHLDTTRIDLLFVESAWSANNGTWKYQLVGETAPRSEISELVAACKERGIPTVFWNKEDPAHYDDFLDTARLFDHVFTTEESVIEDYKRDLPDQTVGLFTFAAQPILHNPIKVKGISRDSEIVFGGMYFRHKYAERREQLDTLLPAASKFQLDIFARNQDVDKNYAFPDEYQKNVVGEVPYSKMLTAYHRYKVVLNVNSVADSKTMCSRRIFEATASGAAVVSGATPAIDHFYPDNLISSVGEADEAYHKIRTLVRSDTYREAMVHKAQRHTWRHHTYEQRLKSVFEQVGLDYSKRDESVSVITPTIRPDAVENVFANFGRQGLYNKQLVLGLHGFEMPTEGIRKIAERHGVENYEVVPLDRADDLSTVLNKLVEVSSGAIIGRMDDDDWYGKYYLEDLLHSLRYSRAQVVGKGASFIYVEDRDLTVLGMPQFEHSFTDFVRGPTITAAKETFLEFPFDHGSRGEDSHFLRQVKENGGKVYSSDRFNFSYFRGRNKSAHTWNASDDFLMGTGVIQFNGRGLEQIEK